MEGDYCRADLMPKRGARLASGEMLFGSRWHSRIRQLMSLGRRQLVILAYHRVTPLPDWSTYLLDPGLISATPQDFDWQMKYVATHHTPISLRDVIDYLRGRRELPNNSVIVTFDDGFADNYQYAFPVMRKYRIPGTIFVSTGYIGNRRPFWFQRAHYLAMTGRPQLLVSHDAFAHLSPTEPDFHRRASRDLLKHLKGLTQMKVDGVLDQLSALCGDDGQAAFELAPIMSWDQLREMVRDGIDIGSHSVDHAVLAHLDTDAITFQLRESKLQIESELQQPVMSVAYPVGRRFAYNAEVKAIAGQLGYRLGATYEGGSNWHSALSPFDLRRQNVEWFTSRAYFRAMLAAPQYFR